MTGILVVLLGLGWLFMIGALILKAILASDRHERRRAWAYGIGAVLTFAVPVGLALDASVERAEAPLCARGHQERQAKRVVWVCDAYEAER